MVSSIVNDLIVLIDGTLTGSITSSQSEPGSNGNEGVLDTLLSSRTGTSLSDCLVSYIRNSLGS